jgi:hypothetical protein
MHGPVDVKMKNNAFVFKDWWNPSRPFEENSASIIKGC